ncbi:hypothetical protein ROZALSC1DRAFT_23408, partial [Rozella allomycis CSF55]
MNFIFLLFLLAWSTIATDVTTGTSEVLPFDIYNHINDFVDVKTSNRFRSTKKHLYQNLKIHSDVLFHWFGKCGPFFDGTFCDENAIQYFYANYHHFLDPNGEFANKDRILKEDLIVLLVKRSQFTPFNCYNYNGHHRGSDEKPDIEPLEYCIVNDMEQCVQILQSRKFYLRSAEDISANVTSVSGNLYIQETLENTRQIFNLISQANLGQDDLNEFLNDQRENLKPVDERTLINSLRKACNGTSTESNFVHLGVWMLRNHFSAFSYSGFRTVMYAFRTSPITPVGATIINKVLQINFSMINGYKRVILMKLFEDETFVTNHWEK